MIQEIDSPVGPVPVLASPLRLSDSPQRLDSLPALGEDTESVLRDLGYSDGEIAALHRDGVI
jgi:itaconate CoA-transferase